jgi:hypothetical protein
VGIIELGQYAGAIMAILILAGTAIKWGIVKPIKAYIDQATYPIHPNSNGGRSLSDVAQTVNRIEAKQGDIEKRVVAIEELVTKPATRTKKTTN